jgi:ABC-2 type transport system permease protein
MKTATPVLDAPVRLSRALPLSALFSLFTLTLRQQARGRRWMVLAVLFLIPAGIGVLARYYDAPPNRLELIIVFYLLPHAMVPLAALVYTSGMVQDEIEDQTLTYLLMRPLPRWALYLTKLLATMALTIGMTVLFTFVTYAAIYWGTADLWDPMLTSRAPRTAALFALCLVPYCTLFGLMGLWTKRSLILGVLYILLIEGILANYEFVLRRWTVMYQFRVLCLRWLGIENKQWSIDLGLAPDSSDCVTNLLVAGLVGAVVASVWFSRTEFKVKTPEGS